MSKEWHHYESYELFLSDRLSIMVHCSSKLCYFIELIDSKNDIALAKAAYLPGFWTGSIYNGKKFLKYKDIIKGSTHMPEEVRQSLEKILSSLAT